MSCQRTSENSEIAIQCKKAGWADDTIAKVLDITVQEVRRLLIVPTTPAPVAVAPESFKPIKPRVTNRMKKLTAAIIPDYR